MSLYGNMRLSELGMKFKVYDVFTRKMLVDEDNIDFDTACKNIDEYCLKKIICSREIYNPFCLLHDYNDELLEIYDIIKLSDSSKIELSVRQLQLDGFYYNYNCIIIVINSNYKCIVDVEFKLYSSGGTYTISSDRRNYALDHFLNRIDRNNKNRKAYGVIKIDYITYGDNCFIYNSSLTGMSSCNVDAAKDLFKDLVLYGYKDANGTKYPLLFKDLICWSYGLNEPNCEIYIIVYYYHETDLITDIPAKIDSIGIHYKDSDFKKLSIQYHNKASSPSMLFEVEYDLTDKKYERKINDTTKIVGINDKCIPADIESNPVEKIILRDIDNLSSLSTDIYNERLFFNLDDGNVLIYDNDGFRVIPKKEFEEMVSNEKEISNNHISWIEYFYNLALLSAKRSKDPKCKVGAVIVNKQNKIVSIGYNGMPNGCDDTKFPWTKDDDFTKNKLSYVVHAELNAILNTDANLLGCTIYVTHYPCNECIKAIVQSGIKKIVYGEPETHKDRKIVVERIAKAAGVTIKRIPDDLNIYVK